MANLKITKPTSKDFDITYRFKSVMEQLSDDRWYSQASVSDWETWDEDDEDYKILKSFKEKVMEEYELDESEFDERYQTLVMWKYIKWYFNYHPSALSRILMCADIAMENAFDQRDEVDTIEWNEKLTKALEIYENQNKPNNVN